VTGLSTTANGTTHAVLWEGDLVHDLNELIDPADPLRPYVTLLYGQKINESGQILATGFDSRDGSQHTKFLVTPAIEDYTFAGFFQPVDNVPTRNLAKAGLAIPVKFSLNGDQGLAIFEPGYPVSQPVTCDASTPTDAVTDTVTAGGSSLSYDGSSDQYSYVWKTDKAWAGTCRQLIVRLNDLTDHVAVFQFK
jgi:hypothetical protein